MDADDLRVSLSSRVEIDDERGNAEGNSPSSLNHTGISSLLNNGLIYSSRGSDSFSVSSSNATKSSINTGRCYTSSIRRSFHLSMLDDEEEEEAREAESELDDSVFFEAQIVASRIADGSILEETGRVGLLDCTPEPDWLDKSSDHSIKNIKLTSEDIFKQVDKMLPMGTDKLKTTEELIINIEPCESLQTSRKHGLTNSQSSLNNNTTVSPTVLKLDCFHNLSNIFQNKSLSTSKLSTGSGRSKSIDAKEILDNLSDILNSDNPTSQQKTEGKNLIYSLADMLCDSKDSSKSRETLDDSGHSSIEMEQDVENPNAIDIVDLRTKPLCDNPQPLDLSVRRSQETLNRSLSCPNVRQPPISVGSTRERSEPEKVKVVKEKPNIFNRISKSQASLPKLNSFGKLLTKTTDDNKKKGPLRATLPIGNMARVLTKSKTIDALPIPHPLYKSKTASTPEPEPNICPVAESTPDGRSKDSKRVQSSPSQLLKPRFNCPVSPLARPSVKLPRNFLLPTTSHNSQKTIGTLNRRKSSSDLKAMNSSLGLKRSNSIAKDSNVALAMNRVTDSISRHSKEAGIKKRSNKTDDPQKPSQMDRLKSAPKPFNLMSKLRRAGKENVDK